MTTYLTLIRCPICRDDASAAARDYCTGCLRVVCSGCYSPWGRCVECEGEGSLVPPDRAA